MKDNLTPEAAAAEAALLAYLDEIGVAWRLTRHPPLFTVEESKVHTGDLQGAHTKNMFLKEKTGGLALVTCLEDRQIKIKHLEKAIGAKRMSFGKPDLLGEVLGVLPGAVTPFAAFNDRSAHRVRVVLDQQMLTKDPQNYHPLHNEATITVPIGALERFFQATGHDVTVVDFDALERQANEITA